VITRWNAFPDEAVRATTFKGFKSQLALESFDYDEDGLLAWTARLVHLALWPAMDYIPGWPTR